MYEYILYLLLLGTLLPVGMYEYEYILYLLLLYVGTLLGMHLRWVNNSILPRT